MANRISTILDLDDKGFSGKLKSIRTDIAAADGATGKFKAAWAGAGATVKNYAAEAGVAVAGMAVAVGVKAVQSFTEGAIAAGKFADASGLTTEEASRWVEVAGDVGVSGEAMSGAFLRMEKAIASGKGAWTEYGIEVKRGSDGQVDASATMVEAIRVISGIRDPLKRAEAASSLWGRGFAQSAEIVLGDADKVIEGLEGVSDAQVFDEDEVRKARELRKAWDDLSDRFQAALLVLGENLVPVLTNVADVVEDVAGGVGKVADGVEKVSDAIDKLGVVGDGIKRVGTYLIPVYGQFKLLGDGVGKLKSLFGGAKDEADALAGQLAGGLTQGFASAEAALAGLADEIAAEIEAAPGVAEAQRQWGQYYESRERGAIAAAEAEEASAELSREALEAGAEAAEEYRDRIDSSYQDAAKSAMSFSDEAKSSLDAYKAELAKSTVETQAFFGHLVAIGRQTSPEFVEHLASMGVGALDMVAEMRATEGGVQEAFDLWSQAAEVAGRDLSAELGAAGTAGSKAFRAALGNEHKAAVGLAFKNGKELGQQQMTGFAAGIDAEKAYAIARARAAAQEINNAMRAALGVPKGAM